MRWLLVLLLVAGVAEAREAEVDHLGLATLLLRDGHPDRAAQALDGFDAEAEGADVARFHTLRGVIALRQRAFADALAAFDAAVAAGAIDASLHLYRARSAYALDDCATTLSAFEAAGQLAESEPDFFLMRSGCHWRQAGRGENRRRESNETSSAARREPAGVVESRRGASNTAEGDGSFDAAGDSPRGLLRAHAAALAALDRGEALFAERRRDFARVRVDRLLSLTLFQAAVDAGQRLIEMGGGLDDVLFVSEALLQAGRAAEARAVLEEARLRFGDDERVLVQLGHAWLGTGHPLVAARMFERAAVWDTKYARDAAELYREQQMFGRALQLNGRLLEQPTKLKQRLALLLDMERFEAAAALSPRLERLGMLTDEELVYALAYARFRLGDFAETERLLGRLRSAALFDRAAALRKAIADCRATEGACD